MTDVWAHWRAACAGQPREIHEGQPQAGFWKMRRRKDGPYFPVAIWPGDDGALVCLVGGEAEPNVSRTWSWCAKHPIPETVYRHWETHRRWPDDVHEPERGIGDNAPPETLTDRVVAEVAAAQEWAVKTQIDSDLQANIAGNRITALRQLAKEVEAEHEQKKRPILEEGRRIDGVYKPLLKLIAEAADAIKSGLSAWMRAEDARRAEEQRKAMEAYRKAEDERRLAEAARKAAIFKAAADSAPLPPLLPIPEPPPPPEKKKVQVGGARGAKLGLRTITKCRITDYAQALAHFAEHEKVRAVVEQLAAAAVKAGGTVPGAEAYEEKGV